jgi:hypothetical protein
MSANPDDDTDPADRVALMAALAEARAEPGRRAEIDARIASRGWQAAARQAAYHLQIKHLSLRPWEVAPMSVADPARPRVGEEDAARLLAEMFAHGLSRYCPDPTRALAEAVESAQRSHSPPAGRVDCHGP